jgi:hypothetical protein
MFSTNNHINIFLPGKYVFESPYAASVVKTRLKKVPTTVINTEIPNDLIKTGVLKIYAKASNVNDRGQSINGCRITSLPELKETANTLSIGRTVVKPDIVRSRYIIVCAHHGLSLMIGFFL